MGLSIVKLALFASRATLYQPMVAANACATYTHISTIRTMMRASFI